MASKSEKLTLVMLGVTSIISGYCVKASAQSSASPYTSAARFDHRGNETGSISPDPDSGGGIAFAAVRNTYDDGDRLVRREIGELSNWQSEFVAPASWPGFNVHQQTDYVYDGLGRKVRETVSSGGTPYTVTQFAHDYAGRVTCTAVRMNSSVFGSLPASACTLSTEGSYGKDRISKNIYDAAGQISQVRNAVGDPLLEEAYVTYSYTPNGEKEYIIDGVGNRTKLTYDGFDRQTRWSFPSSTKAVAFNPSNQSTALLTAGSYNNSDYEEYGYDLNGNRLSLRKRDNQVINYSYDSLDRMIFKDWPGSAGDVAYTYDLRGLRTSALYSATGQGATTEYDGFSRIISSSSNMGGTVRTLSYLYDANGNRTRLTHPDGNWFGYDYDGLDRMTFIRENGAVSGVGVLIGIGYDAQGRRSAISRGNGATTTYVYDPISRLSSIAHDLSGTGYDLTLSFSYNPAYQITSRVSSNDFFAWTPHYNQDKNYSTNGLNKYTSIGTSVPAYDANGNMISDGIKSYVYDVENRLISVIGTTTSTLSYDPMGRLFSESYSGSTAQFLYDQESLVSEYYSGSLVFRYIHGSGDDEPLSYYGGTGLSDRNWFHSDNQESIVLLSRSGGIGGNTNAYNEYGIPKYAQTSRFAYTGQTVLITTGLYNYKARAYSPSMGRFMQTDPVGYDDQMNLYAYAGNDPINANDPSGKAKTWWLVKLLKQGEAGLQKIARISEQRARDIRRKGGNVLGPNKQASNRLQRSVSAPDDILKHPGHPLKDEKGAYTGEIGEPHAQFKDSKKKGHTFWTIGAAFLGTMATALDGLDQLTDPAYVTEMGRGMCPEGGCTLPQQAPAEKEKSEAKKPRLCQGSPGQGSECF